MKTIQRKKQLNIKIQKNELLNDNKIHRYIFEIEKNHEFYFKHIKNLFISFFIYFCKFFQEFLLNYYRFCILTM
jgi:hypothetical protein